MCRRCVPQIVECMPPSLIVVGELEGVVSIEVSTPLPSDETPHKHCPRSNEQVET